MSSLVVLAVVIVALFAISAALLVQIARRPVWSRLVLVAILTRVFDRPQPTRSLRGRP